MSQVASITCPVCKLGDQNAKTSDGGERISVDCRRCGRFTITRTAAGQAEKRNLAPKLSAWIRGQNEPSHEPVEINSKNIDTIEATLPSYSVSQKQLLLLRAIARKSEFPGQSVRLILAYDFPLAWAGNESEFDFYIRTLHGRRLVCYSDGTRNAIDLDVGLEITSDGWDFLDQHARASPLSGQAFVAMSFSEAMKPIWPEAIFPAIDRAGYKPYRVDFQPHIDRIDAKIITEIRSSRFLVADVTEHKLGVYFEAGYALGFGLPVIWTVREDDLSKCHFDTRQYNHVVWQQASDLKEQLYLVVCAVIGKNK